MFAGVSRGDRARLVLGEVVTGNYFSTLGVSARLGRTLLAEDDAPEAPRTVVLSNRYWRREFGGEPAAVGRTLRIRGQEFTIVGVLDDAFSGMVPMLAPEIWVPVRFAEEVEPAGINEIVPSPTGSSRIDRRGQRWLFAKARLTRDTSVEQARATIEVVVVARLRVEHPQTNKDRRVTVRPTADTRLHPEADRMLAWVVDRDDARGGPRAGHRVRERRRHAARARRGASARDRHPPRRRRRAGRLVRQLLTESLILGVLGAGVGVLLASWLTRLLTHVRSADPDRAVARSPAGCARPRLHRRRRAPHGRPRRPRAGAARHARQPGPGSQGRRHGRPARAAAAGRARCARRRADGGDDRAAGDGRTAGPEPLRRAESRRRLPDRRAGDRVGRHRHAALHARTQPAVLERGRAAGRRRCPACKASRSPRGCPSRSTSIARTSPCRATRRPPTRWARRSTARPSRRPISRRSASACSTGAPFAESDAPGDRRVAIVSEMFARTYWPNDSAIGRTVYERTLNSGRAFEIVGVVANHTLQTVGETPQPAIYFSTTQRPSGYNVHRRAHGERRWGARQPDAGDAAGARARPAAHGEPDHEGTDAGNALPRPRGRRRS